MLQCRFYPTSAIYTFHLIDVYIHEMPIYNDNLRVTKCLRPTLIRLWYKQIDIAF